MPTYPAGLPVGYVSLSIYDLIGDLGATGDADDLPDVADVTLTVEMIPTAKMITYGGKGYRLRAYTWTGVSVLTAPDGTGSYTLPATTTLTQAAANGRRAEELPAGYADDGPVPSGGMPLGETSVQRLPPALVPAINAALAANA